MMTQTAVLEELLNGLTDYLLAHLPAGRGCDHALRHTRAWLRAHAPDCEGDFVTFFRQSGHACDCQVLRAALAVPDPFLSPDASGGVVPICSAERTPARPARRRASRPGSLGRAGSSSPGVEEGAGSPVGPQMVPARRAPGSPDGGIRSGAPLWQADV